MKSPGAAMYPSEASGTWQGRRDSNPQHPVLETGALPIRATGLSTTAATRKPQSAPSRSPPARRPVPSAQALAHFLMRGVLAAESTELLQLQPFGYILLVLCS